MKTLLVLVLATLGLTYIPSAQADTLLGRWCDKALPSRPEYNGIYSIIISSEGTPFLVAAYGDGSKGEDKLREVPGQIFEKIGSAFGDKYRIVPSTGDLQLMDKDGLIRTAKRLENSPQPGEC